MKRLYSIDLLKMLCAILVIFIHVWTPYRTYVLPITRCAVPCFFIISGYLVYSENKLIFKEHLQRSIKKIFKIFVWSTILFALIKFLLAFKNNDFNFLQLSTLRDFILFNENPFGFHLWYINAYLYTLLIIFFLLKKNKLIYIYRTIPFLLLMDLCLGKYSLVLWNKEFPYTYMRNFLCVGIPYFSIGMLIKQYKKQILKFNYLYLLTFCGIVLFSLGSMAEYKILVEFNKNTVRDHYISSTFLAISLFLFFVLLKSNKSTSLSRLGEKYSLYIYIFHPLFIILFADINKYLPIVWQEIYLYMSPFIILISTVIFSKLLMSIQVLR